MASSLLNLVDILAGGIHKTKCKYKHNKKNLKNGELNTEIVSAILNTKTLKMIIDVQVFFCFCCFLFFFFYMAFLSQTFMMYRTAGEGGGYLFNSSLPLPPTSQTLRHQLGDYCREFTFAHSQQQDSNWEPLVSKLKLPTTKLRALKSVHVVTGIIKNV